MKIKKRREKIVEHVMSSERDVMGELEPFQTLFLADLIGLWNVFVTWKFRNSIGFGCRLRRLLWCNIFSRCELSTACTFETFVWRVWDSLEEKWNWNWTDNNTTMMNSNTSWEGWQHFFSCIKQTWHDCCCLKSQASLLVSDPVWNWRTFFVTFEYFLIRFCVLLCNSREVRRKCQTFVRIEDCQLFDMEKVNLKLFRGSSFFVDKCKFWHKTRFTCCSRWWESAEMTFRLICADPPVFHRVVHLKFSFHWSRHRLICILKILRDHRKNVEKGVEGLKRATVMKGSNRTARLPTFHRFHSSSSSSPNLTCNYNRALEWNGEKWKVDRQEQPTALTRCKRVLRT